MVKLNLLGLLEDSRFIKVKKLRKKDCNHRLHWFIEDKDYFSRELLGIKQSELKEMVKATHEVFDIYVDATNKLLQANKLSYLDIPAFFHECVHLSWQKRTENPFLLGRFDINGGLNNLSPKIIEFNADTCTTIPETLRWQEAQRKLCGSNTLQFNTLEADLTRFFQQLKSSKSTENEVPTLLASTLGYVEDKNNVMSILDIANESSYDVYYADLEEVVFSKEEGIFHKVGDEYIKIDFWYKLIPWDWIFTYEKELAEILSEIVKNGLCTILNPPYATVWQNKKFMAYISENFHSNYLAKTYLSKQSLNSYVEKPIYGRLGENINIKMNAKNESTKGDFYNQQLIYQEYCPLDKDSESYYYQYGMFFSNNRASSLNIRAQNNAIITDECEFMSHYII